MIVKNNIKIMKGVENLIVDIHEWNAPTILYSVSNIPICSWDQHSRARIGVKFSNYKVSKSPEYIVYTHVYNLLNDNEEFRDKTFQTLEKLEKIRNDEIKIQTTYNLMSRNCSYWVKQDLTSLRGQMSRRLKFCEEEFITGVHWLLRDMMIKEGIKEAEEFLPGCDKLEYCDYSSADYLSNLFGCLFSSCNRQKSGTNYSTFNESCTNVTELKKQLKIKIQKSKYEIDNNIR